jgi:CheY-like chemotaxis protein
VHVSAARILALDDDPLFLRALGDQLTAAGMTFMAVREPTRAVPGASSFNPDLLLVDRHMPVLTGSEVIRSLRAFTETAHIPVAVVTADTREREILRAFKAGAVDVLHKPLEASWALRIGKLLQELAEMRMSAAVGGPSLLVSRLLAFYRRTGRTGALRLNPDTPFEGRAEFHGGELVSAELGPLRGLDALEEMATFDDGNWAFEGESARRPPPASEKDAPRAEFQILFVDDDPDIRVLFQAQLKRAGYGVELAEDGQQACRRALEVPFDLVLADLAMPHLDGWGVLRHLRTDYRTRDVPVIFLSAHDDYRDTLRAARAGAFDYLPKTGRGDLVVGRIAAALAPRMHALEALRNGRRTMRLDVVGPQWAIRRLGGMGATGRFQAEDAWGSYTLALRAGAPVGAKAVFSEREATGISAVAALLASRDARATFEPGPVSGTATLAPDMASLLTRAAETLNRLEERITLRKIAEAPSFDVDEELYEVFRKIGSDRDLMLARAVCEQRVAPGELSAHLNLTPAEVEDGLKELLRRRVISFRGEA